MLHPGGVSAGTSSILRCHHGDPGDRIQPGQIQVVPLSAQIHVLLSQRNQENEDPIYLGCVTAMSTPQQKEDCLLQGNPRLTYYEKENLPV